MRVNIYQKFKSYYMSIWVRFGAVDFDTALHAVRSRVRLLMGSLGFFVYLTFRRLMPTIVDVPHR